MNPDGTFEALEAQLFRTHPGQFAVMCGEKLLGVHPTIDDALLAVSTAFDDRSLPEGHAVLICEIAQPVTVRVTARPYPRDRIALPLSSSRLPAR